mgnify:CR=1 FL=1
MLVKVNESFEESIQIHYVEVGDIEYRVVQDADGWCQVINPDSGYPFEYKDNEGLIDDINEHLN